MRAIEEREERREAERVAQAASAAKAGFVRFVEEKYADYPDLADEDPEELSTVMWELASEHFKNSGGKVATFEQLAEHMQKVAAEKAARRAERRQGRSAPQKSAPGSEQTEPRTNGAPASPGPRSPTTTLSNTAATERASGPRPLSDEELHRANLEELRKNLYGTSP